MKRSIFSLGLLLLPFINFAQNGQNEQGGFKKENIFVGGGLGLGLGGWSGGFNIGANPEVGYSLGRYMDAGISTNINYFSYRAEVNNGYRQRSLNYGGGIFARVYPLKGFFIQALPEYNWISTNLKDMRYTGSETIRLKQEAPSLLVGLGYGTRSIGNSNFFTVIMFDVGDNKASPYVDSYGSKLPVLRTGFNIYLATKRR